MEIFRQLITNRVNDNNDYESDLINVLVIERLTILTRK